MISRTAARMDIVAVDIVVFQEHKGLVWVQQSWTAPAETRDEANLAKSTRLLLPRLCEKAFCLEKM